MKSEGPAGPRRIRTYPDDFDFWLLGSRRLRAADGIDAALEFLHGAVERFHGRAAYPFATACSRCLAGYLDRTARRHQQRGRSRQKLQDAGFRPPGPQDAAGVVELVGLISRSAAHHLAGVSVSILISARSSVEFGLTVVFTPC